MIERVLLIDDEADIRTIGEISLSRTAGWSVTAVGSGASALSLAARVKPDVILLDVMMPGMDGPRTLLELRKLPGVATVPVIFLTAKVQQPEIRRYLALGATGVISKPFDPMTLATQIRQLVGT